LGLEKKKANGDEHSNVEKREKLRAALIASATQSNFEWLSLPTTGATRAKLIHDSIKGLLPTFQYFKADSSLSESDAAIQKYFRSVANTALAANGMAQIESNTRSALQLVLNSVTNKINAVVSDSEKVEAHVEFDWSKAVTTSFKTTGNQANIPLSQRGDGFRRITMMAYFEHLAEEDSMEGEKIIFGFEEPETFLHPTAQEQLFEKLEGLCETGHQVFLTSHSPIIVARTKSPSLVHVKKIAGTTQYFGDVQDLRMIADDLGIRLDNQFISLFDKAKALFLVEGIDDAVAFAHLAHQYKAAGSIPSTFEDLGIVVLPIGGCGSIQHWVQLDLLKKLTKPFFIFLDSDKEQAAAVSSNCTALTGLGFLLGTNCAVSRKRTLENYIPADTLNRLVKDANLVYGDFDNVKDLCKKHPQAGKLGGKKVAEKFFPQLTYEELRTTYCVNGKDDEFLEIYAAVSNLLQIA
jgi:putative ATP-dependent endonuclease of OLD family